MKCNFAKTHIFGKSRDLLLLIRVSKFRRRVIREDFPSNLQLCTSRWAAAPCWRFDCDRALAAAPKSCWQFQPLDLSLHGRVLGPKPSWPEAQLLRSANESLGISPWRWVVCAEQRLFSVAWKSWMRSRKIEEMRNFPFFLNFLFSKHENISHVSFPTSWKKPMTHRLLACLLKVISMRQRSEIFCLNLSSWAARSATLLHCGLSFSNAAMSPALKAWRRSTSQELAVFLRDCRTGWASNSPKL